MSAVQQGRLVAEAVNIIQPDVPLALTKEGAGFGRLSRPAVHSPAHHLSVSDVPLVVAHWAPHAVMQIFHSARTPVGAIDEP